MKGYKLIVSSIIGALLLYRNPTAWFHEETQFVNTALIGQAVADIALSNYQFETENADVSEKYWREQRIIRYSDKEGNLLRYCIQWEGRETNYYIGSGGILIKWYGEETGQTGLWRQDGDSIYKIGDVTNEGIRILSVQQVDFLYDKILDDTERDSYSSFVKLGEQLSPDECEEYERYLIFQSMDDVYCIYSYESDAPNISVEQAMMLCAELLRQSNPDLVLEEVMADDRWGYVGYKFNHRKMGEQILENKIGTRGNISFDGMQLELYMYEDIIDDIESGEGHTATTATFHLFLKDKIIVEEQVISDKEQYLCTEVENGYEVTLYDQSDESVFSEVFPKEPGISRVTEDILEISISVGSPARYVFYFNTKNSNISETYFNPIIVGNNYVAYMENGELILRDIFCEDLMKMRIVRDFTKTADPMSAVMHIEMVDDENIMLTYLKGADYEEVSEMIKIENDTGRLP